MILAIRYPGLSLSAVLLLCVLCITESCDKPDFEPGPDAYPLELTVSPTQTGLELNWTQVTVSTFEEYLVLRSLDPIPDRAEPEISGNTVIVARIDQRTAPTFHDINVPVTDTIYYKVYAKIDGRFLQTPTAAYDQKLHLISFRPDAMTAVPEAGHLIGIDRALNILYVYDYRAREILRTKPIGQTNSPLIRADYGSGEILTGDQGTLLIYDAQTLDLKTSASPSLFREVHFRDGWIYLHRSNFPYAFALYRRSDMILMDEIKVLQFDWRKSVLRVNASHPTEATIYDFSLTGRARYQQNDGHLVTEVTLENTLPGNVPVVAMHPLKDEFVVTNTGVVLDGNLQSVTTLDDGAFSFNLYAYSPDGTRLYGISNQTIGVLRVYDTEDQYAFIREHVLSNQVSPVYLFADEEAVHIVSHAFVDGALKTLITSITHE